MGALDRLRELLALNRAIMSSLDYDEVLRLVVEKTAAFARADTSLLLLGDVDHRATVAASVGVEPERARRFSAPLDERIDAALRELLECHCGDTFLGVPVVNRGGIVGLLAVYRRGSGPPRPDDEFLLSALADQAAVALEHAVRYQKVRQDLHAQKSVIRAAGESIPFGVWIAGADGGVVHLSDSFLQLVGMTLEECSGFGWASRLPPADRGAALADWRRCVARGDSWDYEYRILGADGGYRPILSRGVPVRDEAGHVTGWAGIHLDISERKRLEDALQQRAQDLEDALEHEREIVQTLARGLLGKRPPTPELDIYTIYHPASHVDHVGGDYFDFIDLSRHRMGVVIGDVCGKGLAAARYTAMVKYMLRAYAREEAAPDTLLRRLNDALYDEMCHEPIFVTLCYAVLDLEAGALTYANAGHPPPVRYDLVSQRCEHLEPTGLLLGAMPRQQYRQESLSFERGAVLALMTDGVTDAAPRLEGEGMRAIFQDQRSENAEGIAQAIFGQMWEQAGGELRDDVAIVVARRT